MRSLLLGGGTGGGADDARILVHAGHETFEHAVGDGELWGAATDGTEERDKSRGNRPQTSFQGIFHTQIHRCELAPRSKWRNFRRHTSQKAAYLRQSLDPPPGSL